MEQDFELSKASNLYFGREECFERDVWKIIQLGDFSSFESFKKFWKDKNISLMHLAIKPSESKEEFYQTLWGTILKYVLYKPQLADKAIYLLYFFYFTQTLEKVKVPVDLKTCSTLLKLAHSKQDLNQLIGKLVHSNAFTFGGTVGLKSVYMTKQGVQKKFPKTTLHSEEVSVPEFHSQLVDFNQLHQEVLNYASTKQTIAQSKL